MESYHYEKKWIWESENFPDFNFTKPKLEELFYKLGQLQTVEKFMNDSDSKELLLDVLEDETVATSAIEGEMLQRSSVRSSISKILRLGFEDDYTHTNQTDALVEIIIDAKQNSNEPLSKDRLMTWHKALFPTGQSGFKKIQVGLYRVDADEMMSQYLVWLNEEVDASEIIYKAAIAHLWFLLIHPFDDGNGRIARAISDYVLSKSNLVNANFYSVATTIAVHRKEYYQTLDRVCVRDDLDVTLWMEWFVELLTESIEQTLIKVQTVKTKAMFWDKHINTKLNDRQKKVILKMLASLPLEFEGGMKVSKYLSITKTTRLTSSRDLSDLVEKGVMQSHGSGRGVFYTLVF